jgi:hypothetical protein
MPEADLLDSRRSLMIFKRNSAMRNLTKKP